jgi:hypothetical protein
LWVKRLSTLTDRDCTPNSFNSFSVAATAANSVGQTKVKSPG